MRGTFKKKTENKLTQIIVERKAEADIFEKRVTSSGRIYYIFFRDGKVSGGARKKDIAVVKLIHINKRAEIRVVRFLHKFESVRAHSAQHTEDLKFE